MAKKAKTSIVIGATDLELEKGVVYVQSATFSGPRTSKLFGSRLFVRLVASPETTIPQLWLAPTDERYCSDEQCYLVKAEHAMYELTRYGLSLPADLDGNPIEFEITAAAEEAIADWYDGADPAMAPATEDPVPFVPDTPPVEEPSAEEDTPEPEAADDTDTGEEEDFGYTDETEEDEESSADDDGAIELPDFSAMTRKELVEYATEFELAFNSRTSDEKLREIVKEACLLAMGAGVEE